MNFSKQTGLYLKLLLIFTFILMFIIIFLFRSSRVDVDLLLSLLVSHFIADRLSKNVKED